MERAPCLLLLLVPLLRVSAATPEPCEVDDEDVRCACNFSGSQPDWSEAFQCIGSVEVEIRGGGHSLEPFLKSAEGYADPRKYADTVKALRVRRLTVGAARVPARLLIGVLRVLGYSRLKELTLEDLEVTGTTPPPPLEAAGPALTTLRLRNVSWTAGGSWLAELQPWLKPGLKVLNVADAQSLVFACEQVRTFPALTTLDLSDNPGLGERGLTAALCPHKFPALQNLALRNTGMQTPRAVCAALAAAGVQPHRLDLSHNSLSATANPSAAGCIWPSTLNSLNLSFAGLQQVPKGLPAKLSVLDLSYNRLNREPRPEELPQVDNLTLDGNPFLVREAPKPQEHSMNSGVVPARAPSPLSVGMSGTLVLLQGVRAFA